MTKSTYLDDYNENGLIWYLEEFIFINKIEEIYVNIKVIGKKTFNSLITPKKTSLKV